MPVSSFFHWNKTQGKTLEATGPIIQVEVGVPKALRDHLTAKGDPIPATVTGFALIDTGAFATAIDEGVLTGLGLTPIDVILTSTPHGPGKSNVYPAEVSFPGLRVVQLPMERVIGCNLNWSAGTATSKTILMLLGRDILKHFLLVYNGPESDVTIAW